MTKRSGTRLIVDLSPPFRFDKRIVRTWTIVRPLSVGFFFLIEGVTVSAMGARSWEFSERESRQVLYMGHWFSGFIRVWRILDDRHRISQCMEAARRGCICAIPGNDREHCSSGTSCKTKKGEMCTGCGLLEQLRRARFAKWSKVPWGSPRLRYILSGLFVLPPNGCACRLILSNTLRCLVLQSTHAVLAIRRRPRCPVAPGRLTA